MPTTEAIVGREAELQRLRARVEGSARPTTLALIISGSALLIAAGGAGLAGRDRQRIRHITQ